MQEGYEYTDPRIDALSETISSERLDRYFQECGGDRAAAMRRYVLNTSISESCYTPLQGLEVALRNSLHNRMTSKHGEEWYLPGVAILQHPATEMIKKAQTALLEENKDPTPGRVVAELNFGFWVTVLGPRYENSIWRPAARLAFPNRPPRTERKQIQGALNAIRRLRNRIAHHEPILARELSKDYLTIIKILGWMCPDTATWVHQHSRTSQAIIQPSE